MADHRVVGMPKDVMCVHVVDSKLRLMRKSRLSSLEYCIKMAKGVGVDDAGRDTLLAVGLPNKTLDEPVAERSAGWKLRPGLAVSLREHADLVLLEVPTYLLDVRSVEWLETTPSPSRTPPSRSSATGPSSSARSARAWAYVDKMLEYAAGDCSALAAAKGRTREQIDSMLSGSCSFDTMKADVDGEEGGDGAAKAAPPVAGPPKLSFPIPGSVEGVKSSSRAVLEAKNLSFLFSGDKDYLIGDRSLKLSLGSRVAICVRNGCGKST